MKAEQVKALEKVNNVMLAGQNAARLTLADIKAKFPDCAAITNEAQKLCTKSIAYYRKNFEKDVEFIFNNITVNNTIIN